MKRYALEVFFVLVGYSASWAGTCNVTAPPTRAKINTCITTAGLNGTVNIPAGTVSSGTAMPITQGVTIVGAGVGSTIINGNGFSIDLSVDNRVEISGITFTGTGGAGVGISIGGSIHAEQVVIHDCYFSGYFQAVYFNYIHGVIYNSTLTSNEHHFYTDGYPDGDLGGHSSPPWAWNSQHYWVIEDCTLGPTNPKQIMIVANCPVNYMVRHSRITENSGYPQAFDMHGDATQSSCENRLGIVIYRNDVVNFSNDGQIADIRGGKYSIVWNNTATGAGDVSADCSANPGGSTPPTNTYIWGNTPSGKWSMSNANGSACYNYAPSGFGEATTLLAYPHPLRGNDSPPRPPGNLRIIP